MSNDIVSFFHCSKCIEEIPNGMSPAEYSNLGVGWTKAGVQVVCNRHNLNVVNLDFMGQKVGFAPAPVLTLWDAPAPGQLKPN
jgi:hypothetical protein